MWLHIQVPQALLDLPIIKCAILILVILLEL
jgi:hypothetical protein